MNVYLQHHGIKGQRWGVRRYQNKDGTLTSLGKQHDRGETTSNESSSSKKTSSGKRFGLSKTKPYGKEITMSDEELNYAISRLSREASYRDEMAKRTKAYMSTSEKFKQSITSSVEKTATDMGSQLVSTLMKEAGNTIAREVTGSNEKVFK